MRTISTIFFFTVLCIGVLGGLLVRMLLPVSRIALYGLVVAQPCLQASV